MQIQVFSERYFVICVKTERFSELNRIKDTFVAEEWHKKGINRFFDDMNVKTC
jgi:hypothetical protein